MQERLANMIEVFDQTTSTLTTRLEPYARLAVRYPNQIVEAFLADDTLMVQVENYDELEIATQLESKEQRTKTLALKRAMVAMSQNHNIHPLGPKIVQNIVSKELDVKRLCNIYIRSCGDQESIMYQSTNSVIRDFTSFSPMTRGGSMMTVSRLIIDGNSVMLEYLPRLKELVIKGYTDASPYVRMVTVEITCDLAVNGYLELDRDLFERVLCWCIDSEVYVAASAMLGLSRIVSYHRVKKIDLSDFIDLFHGQYRIILRSLRRLPAYAQMLGIDVFVTYIRKNFRAVVDMEQPSKDIDSFLLYLREAGTSTRNELVCAASEASFAIGVKEDENDRIADNLVRAVLTAPMTAEYSGVLMPHVEIVLASIARCVIYFKDALKVYIREFLPSNTDTVAARLLKCYILQNLVDDENAFLLLDVLEIAVTWHETMEKQKPVFALIARVIEAAPAAADVSMEYMVRMLMSGKKTTIAGISEILCLSLDSMKQGSALDAMRPLYPQFLGCEGRVSKRAKVDFFDHMINLESQMIVDIPDACLLCGQSIMIEEPWVRCHIFSFFAETYAIYYLAQHMPDKAKDMIPSVMNYYNQDELQTILERLTGLLKYIGLLSVEMYHDIGTKLNGDEKGTSLEGDSKYTPTEQASWYFGVLLLELSDAQLDEEHIVQLIGRCRSTNERHLNKLDAKIGQIKDGCLELPQLQREILDNLPPVAELSSDDSIRNEAPKTFAIRDLVRPSISGRDADQRRAIGSSTKIMPKFDYEGDIDEYLKTATGIESSFNTLDALGKASDSALPTSVLIQTGEAPEDSASSSDDSFEIKQLPSRTR